MKLFVLLALFTFQVFASGEIVKHKYFTINYNENHEVPNWVSYELELSHLRGCVSRSNSFKEDPLVKTGSASNSDYKGSGFDRGHLLPAGDRKFSKEAMNETFFLSNMTPQPANFNRGKWGQLETLMRAWALKHQKLWIVTGPVLEAGLPSIGRANQVSVPHQYFKVILRKEATSYKAIAFLISTSDLGRPLREYATSVNHVEEVSGQDFFKFLQSNEEEIEGQLNLADWDFSAKFQYLPCLL